MTYQRPPEDPRYLRENQRLGESRYRSVDGQILAARQQRDAAEAEVKRLEAALEHIRSLGDGARFVAGDPLALYVTSVLADG